MRLFTVLCLCGAAWGAPAHFQESAFVGGGGGGAAGGGGGGGRRGGRCGARGRRRLRGRTSIRCVIGRRQDRWRSRGTVTSPSTADGSGGAGGMRPPGGTP